MKNGSSFRISPMFLKVLGYFFFVWFAVFLAAIVLTMRTAASTARSMLDTSLSGTAAALAADPEIVDALENMECAPSLTVFLDRLAAESSDIDVISVANRDSVRVYHIMPERIGEVFVGDDQYRALAGESYISNATGTMGLQRRAFSPVWKEGQVIGFVMLSSKQTSIEALQQTIYDSYLRIAVPLLVIVLSASVLLTWFFRDTLHGYDPEQLVRDYLNQNDLLDSLEEGVLSVDRDGRILFLNDASERLLSESDARLIGKPLNTYIKAPSGSSLEEQLGEDVPTDRPNVLATVTESAEGNRIVVLKDRTQAMRRAEQLNGTMNIVSALRANNHEFMNRLQVISGLLQMGEIEDAKSYIGEISAEHGKTIGPIMKHIQNANVAALLLGKLPNLAEREIHLTLLNTSSLPRHSAFLTTAEQVKIVGNLVENAMEAVNLNPPGTERSIVLQLRESETELLIEVSDTGPGIAPDAMEHLFDEGFSTKAADGRGYGLFIVKSIVDKHHADIEVESAENGTIFSLIFTQKRERRAEA